MKVSLRSESAFHRDMDFISVRLYRVSKGETDRWESKEIMSSKIVNLKNIFGYKSLQQIAREIVKAQDKLLLKFKADYKYLDSIDALCSEYSKGELVIQDPKTTAFINLFKKN